MQVLIEIPDAKFKAGDVIRFKGDADRPLIMSVASRQIIFEGDGFDNGPIDPKVYITFSQFSDFYHCVYQPGSRTQGKINELIRPGTNGVISREEAEEDYELVAGYDQPLITPDTPENVLERSQTWRAQN